MISEQELLALMGDLESRPERVTILRDKNVRDYPQQAIREFLLNALSHRNYQSNTPVRFHRYSDHLEIINPGGLYGQVSPDNFPQRTDYRDPIVAERVQAAKTRFGGPSRSALPVP